MVVVVVMAVVLRYNSGIGSGNIGGTGSSGSGGGTWLEGGTAIYETYSTTVKGMGLQAT